MSTKMTLRQKYRLGLVTPEEYYGPFWRHWLWNCGWLIVVLLGAVIAGGVVLGLVWLIRTHVEYGLGLSLLLTITSVSYWLTCDERSPRRIWER